MYSKTANPMISDSKKAPPIYTSHRKSGRRPNTDYSGEVAKVDPFQAKYGPLLKLHHTRKREIMSMLLGDTHSEAEIHEKVSSIDKNGVFSFTDHTLYAHNREENSSRTHKNMEVRRA